VPRAILKSQSLANSAIDEATGVITGCKLMQVGKTAHFKRGDGQPDSFEVTAELIQGLLAHAGNRSIPAHWSHDWHGDSKDALHARLGVHKNIRIDEDGDLASDLHTMPNEYGRLAMWTAKTDPASAAFSAVFQYNPIKDGSRKLAVPLSFDAADLVASAAACSAMLSQIQPDTDMTKEEIQSIVKESITAALADFKPAVPASITKDEVSAIVTAALAAHKVVIPDDEKKSIALLAKAELATQIGQVGLVQAIGGNQVTEHAFLGKVAAHKATGATQDVAFLRAQKDHPELYNEYMKARNVFKS